MPDHYKAKVENLVAATYEDGGMTVAAVMPGNELSKISREQISGITAEQVEELVGTIVAARAVGVGVDISKVGNFFYDRLEGFGIVDLHTLTEAKPNLASLPTTLKSFCLTLSNSIGGRKAVLESVQDYTDDAQQAAACLPLLMAYQKACDALPDSVLDEESKAEIAKQVEVVRVRSIEYANQEWVLEKMAKDARHKQIDVSDDDDYL
jgi:hypothetical protein